MSRGILSEISLTFPSDAFFNRLNLEFCQKMKLDLWLFLFSFLFVVLISPLTVYAFDDGFFWEFGSYSIDGAPAGSGATNFFEIYDANLDGNENLSEELIVTVESKNSSGTSIEILNLILTESADDGLFGIDHMVFMLEEAEFEITDTALITVEDPCDEASDIDGNCESEVIETLSGSLGESVTIFSDSDSSGIAIDLIETGPDTGIFTGLLSFSATESDEANAVLHVSQGDVFSVQDQKTGSLTNGLISGNPDRFALLVKINGTVEVTATPSGGAIPITDTITINQGVIGGRGSGGLVKPGWVVDSPPNSSPPNPSGGSGCSECTPPTLGVDKDHLRIVHNGFSYNDNPMDVELYYTPYPLVTVNVGQENKVVLKVYENSGTQNIEHVSIGFGLGHGESFSESKATINVDRTRDGRNLISTFDPENVFENIRVFSEKENCNEFSQTQCMIFTIFHTFREPLEFNMISTDVWDFHRNAWQNYYNHGIHVMGDSLNPPKTKSVAFGSNDMRGLFTLTQIDKFEDKWVDEFGNVYQHKENDRFDKILTIPKKKVFDYVSMHGCDRSCNWFESYKLNQELLAEIELEKILTGKEISNEQKGFIASAPYTKIPRSENVELQNKIVDEILKAIELFNESFNVKNNF